MGFAASKIVIAKALYARGYETNSFVKKLFMQLCRVLPREKLERFCANRDDVHTSMCHTFFAAGKKYGKNIFPRAWFEETVELPFEDGAFPVSAHYDALLSRLYGDYRRLPPPEARKCKEHAALVDLERSYTDYLVAQQAMNIDVYTRSIR